MVLLASDYDQSPYFKAADLAPEKKLRIKDVTEEGSESAPTRRRNSSSGSPTMSADLCSIKTTIERSRGAFGDACDGWTGKIIVLFPTTDEFRGKMVPALRVRIPPPKQAPETAKAKLQRKAPAETAAADRRQRQLSPTSWTTRLSF